MNPPNVQSAPNAPSTNQVRAAGEVKFLGPDVMSPSRHCRSSNQTTRNEPEQKQFPFWKNFETCVETDNDNNLDYYVIYLKSQ